MRSLIVVLLVLLVLGVFLNRSYAHIYDFQKNLNLKPPYRESLMIVGEVNQKNNPFKLAVMGDSLTAGVGADNYKLTYPYLLAQEKAKSADSVLLINFAVPGVNSEQVVATQLDQIVTQKPDQVFILMGINDIHNLKSAKQFEQNYSMLLSKLHQDTKAEIILLTIPYLGSEKLIYFPFSNILDYRTGQFNGIIWKLAKLYNTKVIDLYSLSKKEFAQNNNYYSIDLFHPSEKGYEFWAKIINAN